MPLAMFNPCQPCCRQCRYTLTVTLDWANDADLDLYVTDGASVCYFGSPSVGGLTLNQNSHPGCAPLPTGPEIISGTFTGSKDFYAHYSQFSNCSPETAPTVKSMTVTNTGDVPIWVNNLQYDPGETWSSPDLHYAGYDTGPSLGFAGSTRAKVSCTPDQAASCCLAVTKSSPVADGEVDPTLGVRTAYSMTWLRTLNLFVPVTADPSVDLVVDGTTGVITARCKATGRVSVYTPTETPSLDPADPHVRSARQTDLAGLCGTTSFPYDLRLRTFCYYQCCPNRMPPSFCVGVDPYGDTFGSPSHPVRPVLLTYDPDADEFSGSITEGGDTYHVRVRCYPDGCDNGGDGKCYEVNVRKNAAANADWYLLGLDRGSGRGCPPSQGPFLVPKDPFPDGDYVVLDGLGIYDPDDYYFDPSAGCNTALYLDPYPTLYASFSGGTGGIACLDGFEVALQRRLLTWTTPSPVAVPGCPGCYIWVEATVVATRPYDTGDSVGVQLHLYITGDPSAGGTNANHAFWDPGTSTVPVVPAPLWEFDPVTFNFGGSPCPTGSTTVNITG